MEEVVRRHAGEFEEAYHLLHTVDVIKNGFTYRVEIHQKMATGYRKQFIARYFKQAAMPSVAGVDGTTPDAGNQPMYWIALNGTSATVDTARDALNQALIWLTVHSKNGKT